MKRSVPVSWILIINHLVNLCLTARESYSIRKVPRALNIVEVRAMKRTPLFCLESNQKKTYSTYLIKVLMEGGVKDYTKIQTQVE
jgi:hypothetical protein